jgi:hypothetical protein
MSENLDKVLRAAVYRLLGPLVRVMLRHGMAYGSFAEIARKAYVEEGLDLLRREGRRPTISSVAAMSGLTRKEASRLAGIDPVEGEAASSDQRYNRAVRVITAWALDPRFTGDDGEPRPLPADGDDSFATLVREYSGDVTPGAMLATLESSGTVRVSDAGIELLNRAYLPTRTPGASLNILGNDVAELLTSIDHNLGAEPHDRVFQRKVSNGSVAAEPLPAFRELSNRESQALLERYDAWLSDHEVPDGKTAGDPEKGRYVAIGIYYYDETLREDDSHESNL